MTYDVFPIGNNPKLLVYILIRVY